MRPTPAQLRVLWMISLAAFPCLAVAHITLWFWERERGSDFLSATTYSTLMYCSLAVCTIIVQLLAVRRPLRNPNSPGGPFAQRKPAKLWEVMLVIALMAPNLALLVRYQREHNRIMALQTLKWDRTHALIFRRFRDEAIEPLQEAARLEGLAAESRAKDARGEAWESVTWAEWSKIYAEEAVRLRERVAYRAQLMKEHEVERAEFMKRFEEERAAPRQAPSKDESH